MLFRIVPSLVNIVYLYLEEMTALYSQGVGFERDEGKVSIQWGIEGQGIITPFLCSLYYQGWGVGCPVLAATMR